MLNNRDDCVVPSRWLRCTIAMVGGYHRDCCSEGFNSREARSTGRASCFVWVLLSDEILHAGLVAADGGMAGFHEGLELL